MFNVLISPTTFLELQADNPVLIWWLCAFRPSLSPLVTVLKNTGNDQTRASSLLTSHKSALQGSWPPLGRLEPEICHRLLWNVLLWRNYSPLCLPGSGIPGCLTEMSPPLDWAELPALDSHAKMDWMSHLPKAGSQRKFTSSINTTQ